MRIKTSLRDFLACLSLANLIMMKVWLLLLPFYSRKSFWSAHSPSNNYLAAMVNTILIGLGLWCTALIANHWKKSAIALWPLIYGAAIVFSLNGIRSNWGWGRHSLYQALGTAGALLVGSAVLLLMVGIAFVLIRYRHIVAQQHFRVPLVLAPFILVTFGQSVLALRQVEPESAFIHHEHQNIQDSENKLAMPVVWVIFDEMDYGITFERRPEELLLPELDNLHKTSIFVSQAYSPWEATSVSIPALLTGKALEMTTPRSAVEMTLTGTDGSTSRLQTESTIFADMHVRGSRTALFGWSFPYSRLFKSVDVVKDYPALLAANSDRLAVTVVEQLRTLVESLYFSPFGNSLLYENHFSTTTSMQKDVTHYLQHNQSGGFVFLHYPVPHSMNIYNHLTHSFGPNPNVKKGYLGNMALVDRLLGEIRRTMETAGTWDKALVVVSSDHHWRFNTYDGIIDKRRVPFMVKLPHQVKGVTVNSRFETVETRDLILQIVDGKLRTPEDVSHWMGLAGMSIRKSGIHSEIIMKTTP